MLSIHRTSLMTTADPQCAETETARTAVSSAELCRFVADPDTEPRLLLQRSVALDADVDRPSGGVDPAAGEEPLGPAAATQLDPGSRASGRVACASGPAECPPAAFRVRLDYVYVVEVVNRRSEAACVPSKVTK
jgi:hypothetical protein